MATITVQYKTRKGALLAQLEHEKVSAGRYRVEGYTVLVTRSGWDIFQAESVVHDVGTLTDALEWIAAQLDTVPSEPRRPKPRKQAMSRKDRRALGTRNSRRSGKRGAVLRNRRKGGA